MLSGRLPTVVRLFVFLFLLSPAAHSYAADHFIQAGASTVDCIADGIKAGDTITLASGERGPLTIRDCTGTAAMPITVRNDRAGKGPTVIRRSSASSGGFVFTCRDCTNVVIDGTGKWNGAPTGAYCGAPRGTDGCGIKITSIAMNDSPSAYLMLRGLTTKTTVRGVEIDGRFSQLNTVGIGIMQNDHTLKAKDHPGFWREDFVYERNFIHDLYDEGMYIGPNWNQAELDPPLRNITIRDNLVESTGRESIQLKSALGGTNRIHHNVVRKSGLRAEGPRQGAGISVFEGGQDVKIHHNWVESSGVQGIQHYNMYIPSSQGTFRSEIFNNVVYDAGKIGGRTEGGHGISVGLQPGSAPISATVYNNTIVKVALTAIDFNSEVKSSVARDNIIADWGSTALSLKGEFKESKNLTGSIASMGFQNPYELNFQLTAGSPARNAGTIVGHPTDDHRGTPRPQGGNPDIGAFEFSIGEAEPKAPVMSVQ